MFDLEIFVNDSKTLNLITGMDTFQASGFLSQGLSEPSVLEVGFVDCALYNEMEFAQILPDVNLMTPDKGMSFNFVFTLQISMSTWTTWK